MDLLFVDWRRNEWRRQLSSPDGEAELGDLLHVDDDGALLGCDGIELKRGGSEAAVGDAALVVELDRQRLVLLRQDADLEALVPCGCRLDPRQSACVQIGVAYLERHEGIVS
eukprot:TRINITY_DN758_c0_g1_i1.p2 TRINITY_DN758_c0_g1~~TRINITY_DN758_c0_g1_i1.p2  ORF type:complete len:112 (-),score=13.58 TRINITY_DN758_c0_g1_i1:534-869(-)